MEAQRMRFDRGREVRACQSPTKRRSTAAAAAEAAAVEQTHGIMGHLQSQYSQQISANQQHPHAQVQIQKVATARLNDILDYDYELSLPAQMLAGRASLSASDRAREGSPRLSSQEPYDLRILHDSWSNQQYGDDSFSRKSRAHFEFELALQANGTYEGGRSMSRSGRSNGSLEAPSLLGRPRKVEESGAANEYAFNRMAGDRNRDHDAGETGGMGTAPLSSKDESPLYCKPCEKEFKNPSQKSAHLRSHIKCEEEGCSFQATGRMLKQHMITQHGKEMSAALRHKMTKAPEKADDVVEAIKIPTGKRKFEDEGRHWNNQSVLGYRPFKG